MILDSLHGEDMNKVAKHVHINTCLREQVAHELLYPYEEKITIWFTRIHDGESQILFLVNNIDHDKMVRLYYDHSRFSSEFMRKYGARVYDVVRGPDVIDEIMNDVIERWHNATKDIPIDEIYISERGPCEVN